MNSTTRFALVGVLLLSAACVTVEHSAEKSPSIAPVATAEVFAPHAEIVGETRTGLSETSSTAAASGRMIQGSGSITGFAPEETSVAVDATTISVRQVFEDLGEDATLWYQHVQTLANPYFEGRVDGSEGMERARDYIEFYFRLYGLQPAFAGEPEGMGDESSAVMTSYRQPFEFSTGRRMQVDVENAHASFSGEMLREDEDFVVLGNSGDGEVTGPLSFVGYGIEEGEDGYTSFDFDHDLTGRIALMFRYEPMDEDGVSQWADGRFSQHSGMASKMQAVEARGAAGIVLINPPDAEDGRDGLEPLNRSSRFGTVDIPVIQVRPEVAGRILAAADPEGGDLLAWRRMADTTPGSSVDLPDSATLRFGADVERSRSGQSQPAANMAAVLRGSGDIADEWLVIGGHYDHNGYGMFGTTPDRGPLFPGADDNASGTAGVLILAKSLSELYELAADDANLRSVLFIAFDAEERGLHGSRFYSNNPSIEPEKMTALLNMDMVGRLRDNQLSVLGTGTAEGLEDILRPHFESSGLTVSVTPAGSGRSDDANFARIGVPAMHFFTGMHPEYTSPADQAYTVNPVGAAQLLDLLSNIAFDFVTRPDKLVYTDPRQASRPTQDRGYAPVRLGVQPGMGEFLETGILVEAVSPGTSAAEGGMLAGDVMLRWGEVELDAMNTLVEQLRSHKPGDQVTVTVSRDGQQIPLLVTLKASQPAGE